jgi:hypothetical protein
MAMNAPLCFAALVRRFKTAISRQGDNQAMVCFVQPIGQEDLFPTLKQ